MGGLEANVAAEVVVLLVGLITRPNSSMLLGTRTKPSGVSRSLVIVDDMFCA